MAAPVRGARVTPSGRAPHPLLRPAVLTDAVRIAHLIRRSKAEAMPWLAVPHSVAEDESWAAHVLLPEHGVIVACDARNPSRLLAVLAFRTEWVDQLYVAPGEQGRGLGSRLLHRAKEEAPAGLSLWTFERNGRARKFYERHGFVEVRRTRGENEEREPDILYRWDGTGGADRRIRPSGAR